MLGHDLGEHEGRPLRAEPRDAHEAAQLGEEGMEDRQPGSLDDLQMELLVEVEEVVVETLGRRATLPDQDEPQVVELRVAT